MTREGFPTVCETKPRAPSLRPTNATFVKEIRMEMNFRSLPPSNWQSQLCMKIRGGSSCPGGRAFKAPKHSCRKYVAVYDNEWWACNPVCLQSMDILESDPISTEWQQGNCKATFVQGAKRLYEVVLYAKLNYLMAAEW